MPAPRWRITADTTDRGQHGEDHVGAHHDRAASRPAQAKTSAVSSSTLSTRKDLSCLPSTEMAPSATGPGVSRITSSATETTGDSRMVIAIARK